MNFESTSTFDNINFTYRNQIWRISSIKILIKKIKITFLLLNFTFVFIPESLDLSIVVTLTHWYWLCCYLNRFWHKLEATPVSSKTLDYPLPHQILGPFAGPEVWDLGRLRALCPELHSMISRLLRRVPTLSSNNRLNVHKTLPLHSGQT